MTIPAEHISSVSIAKETASSWSVTLTDDRWLPMGEGDNTIGNYTVSVARPPKGVQLTGRERSPDESYIIKGSAEYAIDHLRELASKIGAKYVDVYLDPSTNQITGGMAKR
jgi:hypothetical protein